jgi:hypothetical protein
MGPPAYTQRRRQRRVAHPARSLLTDLLGPHGRAGLLRARRTGFAHLLQCATYIMYCMLYMSSVSLTFFCVLSLSFPSFPGSKASEPADFISSERSVFCTKL